MAGEKWVSLVKKIKGEKWECRVKEITTAWKVSKYGVISGRYFPVFRLNTGKHGPEITPCLDTFHAVYFESKQAYNNDK